PPNPGGNLSFQTSEFEFPN
ncbi:hypothetical protein Zm00014a_041221, partial [Zea mays]